MTGIELISGERDRQLAGGYDADHDDCHDNADLVAAALNCLDSYLCGPGVYAPLPDEDVWGLGVKHNLDPVRLLAVAGALIAAEIDRLQRAGQEVGV